MSRSSRTSERRSRRCPGTAEWRGGLRARAVLIVSYEGEKVLGPRFIRLLEEIRSHGSVRAAAGSLGLGYRHALDWIQRGETVLARPLVERRAGGASGGGALLTPDAVQVIQAYRRAGRALGRVVARAEAELLHPC